MVIWVVSNLVLENCIDNLISVPFYPCIHGVSTIEIAGSFEECMLTFMIVFLRHCPSHELSELIDINTFNFLMMTDYQLEN